MFFLGVTHRKVLKYREPLCRSRQRSARGSSDAKARQRHVETIETCESIRISILPRTQNWHRRKDERAANNQEAFNTAFYGIRKLVLPKKVRALDCDRLWPIRLWPNRLWPKKFDRLWPTLIDRLWPKLGWPTLAKPTLANFTVSVFSCFSKKRQNMEEKAPFWVPKGGTPKGVAPKGAGPT